MRLSVLGVANLDILKAFVLGVAPNNEPLFSALLGEPASVTFVGDAGRLAGDCSNEVLKELFCRAALGAGRDGLNGDCNIEP